MTARYRAQIAELLRCAADQVGCMLPIRRTCDDLNRPPRHYDVALEVRASIGPVVLTEEGYRAQLLEAAARVEEGSWP